MTNNVYRAGIYCRLSSDDGSLVDSSSIQTQKFMLEKYCNDNNFIVHDFYVDDGYSGLNFNRPAFNRLLSDIEQGKINLIITKDLSRLGRDYIQTGYYTEIYFQSKKVRYIAVNDAIDTISDNNDIAPFKNILNDLYAKDLSKKVKSAKRQRALRGMFISAQTPFGYKKDPLNPNRLVIDEEAAVIVREIFSLALQGKGTCSIKKHLTKNKVMTPGAYKSEAGDTRFDRFYSLRGEDWKYNWSQPTVHKILKDMVYIGDMENRKYEIENYKTKKRVRVPEDKRIVVKDTHEAIISRSDFERVQELIASKRRVRKNNFENLFKSILFCKTCNHRLHLAEVVRPRRNNELMYKCAYHFINPKQCPQNNSINYDQLKEIISNRLRSFFKLIKNDKNLLESLEQNLNKDNHFQKIKSELAKLEQRLEVLVKMISRLYNDNAIGTINDSTCDKLLKEYQVEQNTIESRIKEICKQLKEEKNMMSGLSKLKEEVDRYLDFKELTQEMVNALISKIVIEHKKKENGVKTQEINIVWRFVEMSL